MPKLTSARVKPKKKRTPQQARSTLGRRADRLFSLYIRERDNWTCVRCGWTNLPPTNRIQAAHIISRRYHSVRWSYDNCKALCSSCHSWETHNPIEGRRFWRELIGEDAYADLEMRALEPWDRDIQAVLARLNPNGLH